MSRIVLLLAIMLGSSLPPASAVADDWSRVRRWLWPREQAQQPPVPEREPALPEIRLPPSRPAAAPMPPPPAPPALSIPVQKKAGPRKSSRPAPVRRPAPVQKKKPRERAAAGAIKPAADDDGGGANLPWPCFVVRLYGGGKSRAQLEEMGKANGISLSPKQRRQAQACLAGK